MWMKTIFWNSILFYGVYMGVYEHNIIAERIVLFFIWFITIVMFIGITSPKESFKKTLPKNLPSETFKFFDILLKLALISALVGGGWFITAIFYTIAVCLIEVYRSEVENKIKETTNK